MIIGYARVSTDEQNLDAQTDALKAAGAERIYSDRMSGTKRNRPELDKMLDQFREGDVVVVTKYDRLARSLRDLLDIIEAIKGRGAGFRSLAEDIDTTTPAGRLIFHVFASVAQFERERISERTREERSVNDMNKRYEKPLTPKELAARPDSEIDYSDIPELDDHFWENAKVTPPRTKPNVSLRVPQEVVEFFKAENPKGYTARMAAVLESYVRAKQAAPRE